MRVTIHIADSSGRMPGIYIGGIYCSVSTSSIPICGVKIGVGVGCDVGFGFRVRVCYLSADSRFLRARYSANSGAQGFALNLAAFNSASERFRFASSVDRNV